MRSTKSTTSTRKKPITDAISSFARSGRSATARAATRAATRAVSGLRGMFGLRPATAPVITVEMHDLPVAPAHAAASSRDRTDVDDPVLRINRIRAQIQKLLSDSKNKPIVNIVRKELDRLSELSQQREKVMRSIQILEGGKVKYKTENNKDMLRLTIARLEERRTELKNIQSDLGALQKQFYGPGSITQLKLRLQNTVNIKQTAGSTRKRRKHKKK
jgi:hypothetical protein